MAVTSGFDAGGMDTNKQPTSVDIVAVLLLMQAGIASVSTLEALVSTLAFGPSGALLVLLNGALAVGLVLAAGGLRRRSDGARRFARVMQVGFLIWAAFDMALALALADRTLELVPIVTRIIVPVAIFRLLKRPQVRAEFESGGDTPPSTISEQPADVSLEGAVR